MPRDVGPGTQWIACIEFKNGKGEPSCFTDTFNSDSQPDRIHWMQIIYATNAAFFILFLLKFSNVQYYDK